MIRACRIPRPPLISLYRYVGLILACNYFAFQVEIFDDEYEANHPQHHRGSSILSPTLTWESFDKDNAPQPFVFDALITIEYAGRLAPVLSAPATPQQHYRDIRDKSPPFSS